MILSLKPKFIMDWVTALTVWCTIIWYKNARCNDFFLFCVFIIYTIMKVKRLLRLKRSITCLQKLNIQKKKENKKQFFFLFKQCQLLCRCSTQIVFIFFFIFIWPIYFVAQNFKDLCVYTPDSDTHTKWNYYLVQKIFILWIMCI